VRQFCPSLVSFRFSLWIDENATMTQKPTWSLYNIVLVVSLCKPSEPYNKICFDNIHMHCNKQLFFILTVSQ
jgi:hypothetical protein